MPKVKFVNEKVEIDVEPGANLRQVALDNGIALHHHGLGKPSKIAAVVNCSALPDALGKVLGKESPVLGMMGGGFCGTCNVFIKKGMENCSAKGVKEKLHLAVSPASIGHEDEIRLACQTKVNGDIEVETNPSLNLFGERFW